MGDQGVAEPLDNPLNILDLDSSIKLGEGGKGHMFPEDPTSLTF